MAEILLNLITVLMCLMRCVLYPFYALIHYKKLPGIPPIENPLLKVSATTLARKIRNGELSSQTVVEAYIERIKEVNPLLNAIIEERFEAALKEAKRCDEMLKTGQVKASILEKEKPLYGIPITIKESLSVKGMSLTGCCLTRKGFKATNDGETVKMIKDNGAIILLVSNTAELCSGHNTYNYIVGQTVNPYDRRKSSGGSTGGEAALIAAGASVLGMGSDLTGSVRLPASFCGIYGHKPTPDIISNVGHYPVPITYTPLLKCLTIGPLARYVEDIELMMKTLTAKIERPLRFGEPLDIKKLRVYYVDNFPSFCNTRSTVPEIRGRIHRAVQFLSENGAHVEHLSDDWVRNIYYMALASFREAEPPEYLADPYMNPNKKRPYLEFIKSIFGLSAYTISATFIRVLAETGGTITHSRMLMYQKLKEELHQEINNTLKDDGVFIYPIVPHPPTYPELMFFKFEFSDYPALANILYLPSTAVPMGLNKDGVPIGFQVTAGSYQDHLCIAVAKEFEKTFGGWIPPS